MLAAIACAQDQDESLPRLLGTVTAIIDGDTIKVLLDSGEIKVRFHGVDAPEKNQPGGWAANQALAALMGQHVELEPFEQDQYDRLIATVFLDDVDINAELVKRGQAWAYRRYMKKSAPEYCTLEAAARTAKLGLWGLQSDQIIAPWEWRRRKKLNNEFTSFAKATAAQCIAAIGKPYDP